MQGALGREQKQSECSEAQSIRNNDDEGEVQDIITAFSLVVSWSVTVATYSRVLLDLLEQHGGYLCKVCAKQEYQYVLIIVLLISSHSKTKFCVCCAGDGPWQVHCCLPLLACWAGLGGMYETTACIAALSGRYSSVARASCDIQ